MASFLEPVVLAIQVLREAVAHIDETPLPTHDGSRYLWAFLAGNQVFFHVGGRGAMSCAWILGLPLDKPTSGEQARAAAQPPGPRWQFVHIMADGYTIYTAYWRRLVSAACCAGPTRCGHSSPSPWIPGSKPSSRRQALCGGGASRQGGGGGNWMGGGHRRLCATTSRGESQPQLTEIKTLLTAAPAAAYGEGTDQQAAIDFVLRQWPRFAAYAQQGDLPIDNNDAERALRMIVIGRKNWMLVGSEDAAPSAQPCSRSWRAAPPRRGARAYLSHVVKQLRAGYRRVTHERCRLNFRFANSPHLASPDPGAFCRGSWKRRRSNTLRISFSVVSPSSSRRKRPCPRARSTTDAPESPSDLGKPSGITPRMLVVPPCVRPASNTSRSRRTSISAIFPPVITATEA